MSSTLAMLVAGLAGLAAFVNAEKEYGPVVGSGKFEEDGIAGETFDILSALWDAAGLPRSVNEPRTLFAPTDSAFVAASLALGAADGRAKKEDIPALIMKELESRGLNVTEAVALVLRYHVVEGSLKATDVLAMKKLQTAIPGEVIMRGGEDMEATQLGDGATSVRDPRIISTDFEDSRGLIVHAIDGLLIPKAFAKALDLFVVDGAGVMPVASGKGCKYCEEDELCTATPWEKKKTALCLPSPPMCYLTLEKNKGSEGEVFVPYAPCCSGEESVMSPVLGQGSYCLP